MPVVGEFHGKLWRARANAPAAPVAGATAVYPKWQNSVHRAVSLSMVGFWLPLDALRPLWAHLCWYGRLAVRLWRWRAAANRARLELWIARLEALDDEQAAVVERVWAVLHHHVWTDARAGVRRCATSPKFHQPEQWLAYSRALKANAGQAQNVFRHVKVVHELRAAHPGLSNPDAHLLVELAYQGFAAAGRADRQIVTH